jgi:Protein of unknown function (DUF2398)
MAEKLETLLEKRPEQIRAILNVLLESAYFYRSDNEDLFLILRRCQQEFRDFFRDYFDWELIIDGKCARVYKEKWHNEAITPANRHQFRLAKRDDCIAFMLLIEFFEKLLEENSMTVEDNANPRFTFGELLEYERRRFCELFEEREEEYTAEYIRRNILAPLMPHLLKYRFLRQLQRPKGLELTREQLIFEAMPALYHYNSGRLSGGIGDIPEELEIEIEPPEIPPEEEIVSEEEMIDE